MTSEHAHLLSELTAALGSEALAEEVLAIVERAAMCSRCGALLDADQCWQPESARAGRV